MILSQVRACVARSPSARDLRTLVEVAGIVIATWLLLGQRLDVPIAQADGTWLVAPYVDGLLAVDGDWSRHLYRFGVLGGSDMHPFGGTLPLVQVCALLGLSTSATLNVVTISLQVVLAVLGILLAEGLASHVRGARHRLGGVERVAATWLIAFAPVLGWRLTLGHDNLVQGLLPLVATLALIWQARAGGASPLALGLAAAAVATGVSGLGAQSVINGAVFGLPLVVASLWPGRGLPLRPLAAGGLALAAGVLLALPRLAPMLAHALDPATGRSTSAVVASSYGVAPLSDFLTSVPWTLAGHAGGGLHEHNYPLGPLALLLALAWALDAPRRVLIAMAATLAVVILFACDIPPVGGLVRGLVPLLSAFRGPSRATLVVLVVVAPLVLATLGARTPAEPPLHARRAWLAALGMAAMIPLLRGHAGWAREVVAWLACGALVVLVRTHSTWLARGAVPVGLVVIAALGVLAFDERIPRGVPVERIDGAPAALRAQVRAAAPALTTALDRLVIVDPPPPFEMSLAFAARLPSLDGVWYPPRRFLELVGALEGRRLPATTAVFRLSSSRAFPVLQQLYNVRLALRGFGTTTPSLDPLPRPPGAAWFPVEIVDIDQPADMVAALRASADLRATLTRTAWRLRGDGPARVTGCVRGQVRGVTTDEPGQRARIDVEVPEPCTLIVATNHSPHLRATGTVAGVARALDVFPLDVALTAIAVPAGTTDVALYPTAEVPAAARAAQLLGALALVGALVLGGFASRRRQVSS